MSDLPDAVLFASGLQLREYRGRLAVFGRVADVVLAGRFGRRVNNEFSGTFVVDGRSFDIPNVGAVANLRHGETAGKFYRPDIREIFFLMTFGAQPIDASAEQPELNAEFNH